MVRIRAFYCICTLWLFLRAKNPSLTKAIYTQAKRRFELIEGKKTLLNIQYAYRTGREKRLLLNGLLLCVSMTIHPFEPMKQAREDIIIFGMLFVALDIVPVA